MKEEKTRGKLPSDVGESLMELAKGITKLKDGEEISEDMEKYYKKITEFGDHQEVR